MVIIVIVTHIPRVCLLEHNEDYNQGCDAALKAFNMLESINILGTLLLVTHKAQTEEVHHIHFCLFIYRFSLSEH